MPCEISQTGPAAREWGCAMRPALYGDTQNGALQGIIEFDYKNLRLMSQIRPDSGHRPMATSFILIKLIKSVHSPRRAVVQAKQQQSSAF
jgi:hypothetical protein